MFPAPKAATSTTKTISTTKAVTANADIVVEERRREEKRDAAGIGRVWHEGIMYLRAEVNFVALVWSAKMDKRCETIGELCEEPQHRV
jgi:phage protein D